jgi:hypothetical protein
MRRRAVNPRSCITPTLRPRKAGPPHFGCSDGAGGESSGKSSSKCSTFRAGCLVVRQRRNRARAAGVLWTGWRFAASIATPRQAVGQASFDLAHQIVRPRIYRRGSGRELPLPFRILKSSGKRSAAAAYRPPQGALTRFSASLTDRSACVSRHTQPDRSRREQGVD